MKKKELYVSPQARTVEAQVRRVVCTSNTSTVSISNLGTIDDYDIWDEE